MAPRSLIIDCDPGVDDAIALLLAFASPQDIEVLAVTTVGGNVGADLTARNACLIRQISSRPEVPVFAGAQSPMVREPVAASHFHGVSGLGDLAIFEPEVGPAPGHAVQAIVDIVMSRPPGSVGLAITGPMTNVAMAMRLEPRLAARLGPVAVMGGARSEGGNITASAEYNIFADPHAADIVFASGCSVTVMGLDATHQVRATPQRLAAIETLTTPAGRAAAGLIGFAVRSQKVLVGWDSPPLHDPCTLAWFIRPQLFETAPVNLRVETASPLTLGHTAVEFRLTDALPANARWVTRIDAEGLFDLLLERLGR